MKKENPWKKLSSKVVYKTKWLKVVEDRVVKPSGIEGIFPYVATPDQSVFIVALTEKSEVYLIRQYRYPSGIFSWEIPGGGCDSEKPEIAAKRELKEETGLIANSWEYIGWFIAMNDVCEEKTNVFIARNLTQSNENEAGDEGILKIQKFKLEKVLAMIQKNELTDGQSIAAILKTRLYLTV